MSRARRHTRQRQSRAEQQLWQAAALRGKPINQGEGVARTLLDVVVRKGAAVLKLLAGEDQALLVGRDALLVLDLGLDIVDRVRRLDLQRDGLTREGLDENLHGAFLDHTGRALRTPEVQLL